MTLNDTFKFVYEIVSWTFVDWIEKRQKPAVIICIACLRKQVELETKMPGRVLRADKNLEKHS